MQSSTRRRDQRLKQSAGALTAEYVAEHATEHVTEYVAEHVTEHAAVPLLMMITHAAHDDHVRSTCVLPRCAALSEKRARLRTHVDAACCA